MLIATETRKASVHGTLRNPSTKRSEVVNPTSNSPPTISHSQGMKILSLDACVTHSLRSRVMAKPRDHRQQDRAAALPCCSSRLLIVGFPIATQFAAPLGARRDGRRSTSRRSCSCCRCLPLLGTREARVIREHARDNDANRVLLLVLTGIVMAVLLIAISAEAVGHNPQPLTKALIIVTLGARLAVRQHVYALPLRASGLQQAGASAASASISRGPPAAGLLGFHLFRLHLRDGVRRRPT